MKNLLASSLVRSRYLMAILAGLVLASAFPNISLAGAAWIGPGLLLAATLGKRGAECLRIGYVGGLAYYLAGLYWLLYIPYRWHGIPLGPAAGWLALSTYCAIYPAVWVWLAKPVQSPRSKVQGPEPNIQRSTFNVERPESEFQDPESKKGSSEESENRGSAAEAGTFAAGFEELVAAGWARRALWALRGAAAWVGLEMVLARLFSGFPWDLLGVSQYQMTPLIQFASFTGVYGVSFLLVWFSLALVATAAMVLRPPSSRSIWVAEIFLPLLVVAILFNAGFRQLRRAEPPTRTIRITFVQPSIPQTLIWDESKDDERFHSLIQLSEQALTNRTDLLVWPEAAIPKLLWYDKETIEAVTGLARKHHVWLIVGGDDAEPRRNSTKPNDADYFNSAFLIDPQGRRANGYRKRNLVIFGEYIPLVRWLPFMKFFTPIPDGFTPGEHAAQFELTDLKVKVSPLICFEDTFPATGRDSSKEDTDFLLNITNDGWFGESAEPWQHAASAVFRAVENGLPLLRCTNTGLTCWVDAQGRLRQIFVDEHGSVYGAGIMTAEIPLLPAGVARPQTFYNLHGDWFGWGCVGITGVMLLPRLRGRFDFPRR